VRRTVAVTLALATAALSAAAASADGPKAHTSATYTVVLRNIAFNPPRLTIARGDSVRWVWRDPGTQHNITSRGKVRFRSAGNRARGSHVVRLRRRGTYRYSCTIHFGMNGTIVVQ
jgi:plastocyanin